MQSLAMIRRHATPSPKPQSTIDDMDNDDQDPPAGLMSLPPELHLMISRYLIYPDALSLKHTSRHFYLAIDTGVRLKVDWLIERRSLDLVIPHDIKCDMRSDSQFCKGLVRLLMERRREHAECECRPNIGCLVYGTAKCLHRQRGVGLHMRRMLRRWSSMSNVLAAFLAILVAVLWAYVLFPRAMVQDIKV